MKYEWKYNPQVDQWSIQIGNNFWSIRNHYGHWVVFCNNNNLGSTDSREAAQELAEAYVDLKNADEYIWGYK